MAPACHGSILVIWDPIWHCSSYLNSLRLACGLFLLLQGRALVYRSIQGYKREEKDGSNRQQTL